MRSEESSDTHKPSKTLNRLNPICYITNTTLSSSHVGRNAIEDQIDIRTTHMVLYT